MALNSTFVINRMGLATCKASNRPLIEPMDKTYTASRLGLTFAGCDQQISEPAAPRRPGLQAPDTLDSRLGISSDSETAPGPVKVSKPFWPRFRSAVAVLSIAVKNGILHKLAPPPHAFRHDHAPEDFLSHPVDCPSPKASSDYPSIVYRKGTYKMPVELLAHLKSCAATNHMYQYRLVTESLEEFLTTKEFAEPDDSPTE